MEKEKSLLQMPKNQTKAVLVLTGLLILLIFNLGACNSASDEPQTVTIGVMNLAPVLEPVYEGFRDEMTELGYIEGENIIYIYAGPTGDIAKLDEVAQGLVDQNVDLILALSTPAAAAAIKATQEIPIIFAPISDPLRAGLVTNLAQPDGNATGVQWGLSEPRRLEWLLTLDPDIEKIYIPYNPEDNAGVVVLGDIQEAAEQFDVELVLQEARDGDEITAAIESIPDDADAIYLLPDNLVVSRVADFAEAAIAREMPLTAPGDSTAEAGGLMAYGLRFYPAGQQSAQMAHQVLQGVAAGDLPVETTEFFLAINLKTANAIGLEISDDILRQADTIIRE